MSESPSSDDLASANRESSTADARVGFLAAGTLIDQKYKILEILGAGSHGTVYKALHLEFSRIVALKVLRTGLSPEVSTYFLREAKLLCQLRHPAIAQCYTYGATQDGLVFFTMEYKTGTNLSDVIVQGGALKYRQVLDIAAGLAAALEYAHCNGVIHRDIKPTNIILSPDGAVVLLDLGLAKILEAKEGVSLTLDGTALGTPLYMSPEQCDGRKVDARSDIYSLGCVLHELLTAQPPFDAESAAGVMFKHLYSPAPPLLETSPEQKRLNEKILLCMEKDPKRRFPTASALLKELQALTADLPSKSVLLSPVRGGGVPSSASRHPRDLAGVLLTAAVACTVMILVVVAVKYQSILAPAKPISSLLTPGGGVVESMIEPRAVLIAAMRKLDEARSNEQSGRCWVAANQYYYAIALLNSCRQNEACRRKVIEISELQARAFAGDRQFGNATGTYSWAGRRNFQVGNTAGAEIDWFFMVKNAIEGGLMKSPGNLRLPATFEACSPQVKHRAMEAAYGFDAFLHKFEEAHSIATVSETLAPGLDERVFDVFRQADSLRFQHKFFKARKRFIDFVAVTGETTSHTVKNAREYIADYDEQALSQQVRDSVKRKDYSSAEHRLLALAEIAWEKTDMQAARRSLTSLADVLRLRTGRMPDTIDADKGPDSIADSVSGADDGDTRLRANALLRAEMNSVLNAQKPTAPTAATSTPKSAPIVTLSSDPSPASTATAESTSTSTSTKTNRVPNEGELEEKLLLLDAAYADNAKEYWASEVVYSVLEWFHPGYFHSHPEAIYKLALAFDAEKKDVEAEHYFRMLLKTNANSELVRLAKQGLDRYPDGTRND